MKWHPREGITFEADLRHAETISRDKGAENLNTISTPAAKETERETEEEKRQDLKERRVSGKLGSKMNDDDKDEARSADEVTRYRRIAARANFLAQDRMDNRVCYEGSSEANDSTHDRRLEQTRQAGKILCPIPQSCELVQVPERIREGRGVH